MHNKEYQDQIERHFNGAVRRTKNDGFYLVNESIGVFKKTKSSDWEDYDVIVNLIIPAGATIHAPIWGAWDTEEYVLTRKFRASEAYVHSQFKVEGHWGCDRDDWESELADGNITTELVNESVSEWDHRFLYRTGTTVRPNLKFSMVRDECESGIHFFADLYSALEY